MLRWIRVSIRLAMLAGVMAAAAPARTQAVPVQTQVVPKEEPRATSTPYTGDLAIFEKPGRDERLQTNRILDLLKLAPGKNVADIGAGSGWFTVRAARRVEEGGMVYAEDINPQAIQYIDKRAEAEKLINVKTVLGTPNDTKLRPATVDAVMLMKVYHEIAHPIPLMEQVRVALRPGGLVGIIDRNGNGADHGLNRSVVEKEMGEAGYKLEGTYDFTKADGQDYFLIFSAL